MLLWLIIFSLITPYSIQGMTPLGDVRLLSPKQRFFHAVMFDKFELVKESVAQGIDINMSCGESPYEELSALYIAVLHKRHAITKFLLAQKRIKPNVCGVWHGNNSILHHIAKEFRFDDRDKDLLEIAQALVAREADLESKNYQKKYSALPRNRYL